MASEYLKWKYRNEQPEEKHGDTGRNWKNWFHYHKWFLLAGVIVLGMLGSLFSAMFGIGKTKPDLEVAAAVSVLLSDEDLHSMEEQFAHLAGDYNHDGKTVVRVHYYRLNTPDHTPENDDEARIYYASEIQLAGDLEECDSFLFLMDDPDRFQRTFQILSLRDGSEPEEYTDASGCTVHLSEIEGFSEIPAAENLYLARRRFPKTQTVKHLSECETMWKSITEHVIRKVMKTSREISS
jgi:hypothetical protein